MCFLKRNGIGKQNRWILLPTLMFVIKKQWISPLKEKFNNLNIYITCRNKWYICKLLMNYVLGKRILNILNRVIFFRENTNIDVSVFMFDLRMINIIGIYNINMVYIRHKTVERLDELRFSFLSLLHIHVAS